MMEGARRHVHRAHVTTLAFGIARGTRTRRRVAQTRPPTAEACAPTDFVRRGAAIQGAPPERMDVRVTRTWPTTGTYGAAPTSDHPDFTQE